MLESKDHKQVLRSSGALDLTFASRARGWVGNECQYAPLGQYRNVRYDFSTHEIIDDHRTVEPSDDRLATIELLNARSPFTAINLLGSLPRFPKVNTAGRATIFRANIIFSD